MSSIWETADAVALRAYLGANPRFIQALKARIPAICKELNIEARAMSGSERAGADNVLAIIETLQTDVPKQDDPGFMA